jgi:predicted dehydrogenase
MVAENYYYKPSLRLIKQLINEQYIGDIRSVRVRKTFKQPASGWKRRYGALLEGGIHFIALISAIFDDAPEKIEASFPGAVKGQAERNSITTLGYKNNASAQLSYSWNTTSLTRGIFQHSYIVGEKGFILFESNGLYLFISSSGKSGFYLPGLVDVMGYQMMTKDFIMSLDDGRRTPSSDFHKAKRDLSIVFQAYKYLPV